MSNPLDLNDGDGDFCLVHGREFMRSYPGHFAYCAKCDAPHEVNEERPALGTDAMRERPEPIQEEYLGDGLYASFDGWQICLRAPRDGGDHAVYIEPVVWDDLARFAKLVWQK